MILTWPTLREYNFARHDVNKADPYWKWRAERFSFKEQRSLLIHTHRFQSASADINIEKGRDALAVTQRGFVFQKKMQTSLRRWKLFYIVAVWNRAIYVRTINRIILSRATVYSETTRAKREMRRASYQGRYPSAHIIASSIPTRFQAITPVKRSGVFGAGMPGRNYVPCSHDDDARSCERKEGEHTADE